MADQKKGSDLPLSDLVGDNDVFFGIRKGVTTRTAAASLRAYLGSALRPEQFGAKGDGVNDDTEAINKALSAGRAVLLSSGKTYIVSGVNIQSGHAILGDPANRPIIKLKNSANAHTVFGNNVSDVVLRDIIVDGNKSAQSIGSGNNWRGVYFLGNCARISATRVTVINAVDHGFFLSDGNDINNRCGRDSTILDVRAENCGSQAHLDAGGAGGSGMVGGVNSTRWISCVGTGNRLNGMKSMGVHIACHSYLNGSGFETGFDTPEKTQTKYFGCEAKNNVGDGWRNQGQGDELTWVGCTSEANGQSGISFINKVSRAVVNGCFIKNNGQNKTSPYSDVAGFAGIFVSGTSEVPDNISICGGTQIFDDQAVKTQRHNIYVNKPVNGLQVSDDCFLGDAAIQKTYIAPAAGAAKVDMGSCMGLDGMIRDLVSASLTGTLSTTVIKTTTIPARSIPVFNTIHVVAKGSVAGTAGTKIVRFSIGSVAMIVVNETAAETVDWCVEADIYRIDGSTMACSYRFSKAGAATTSGLQIVNSGLSADLTLQITGALGNVADTITQQIFIVETR